MISLGCPGRVLLDGRGVGVYAESLNGYERGLIKVSGRYVAGETIVAGRLLVRENGLAVHGAPSRGPVLGVALARIYDGAYDEGEMILILRCGEVIPDGELGADLESARVDASGRFVRTGGEIVPSAVYAPGGVEINLA